MEYAGLETIVITLRFAEILATVWESLTRARGESSGQAGLPLWESATPPQPTFNVELTGRPIAQHLSVRVELRVIPLRPKNKV